MSVSESRKPKVDAIEAQKTSYLRKRWSEQDREITKLKQEAKELSDRIDALCPRNKQKK